MTQLLQRPERTEAVDYYFTYIDQVPAGDIKTILATQARETSAMLRSIADDRSLHRYAPNKWSVRETVGHINDAERVFTFRAFWFARGFDLALPSFDQDVAVAGSNADARSWHSHVDEFDSIRAATLTLFSSLPEEAWSRTGLASGNSFSVRALAFIVAGHVAHHVRILRERHL